MDAIFNYMDLFRKYLTDPDEGFGVHLEPYHRQTSHPFPLVSLGYIPRKTYIVTHSFNSLNFSFILKGSGFYFYRGVKYPVQSPCVITQMPGEPMHYGPNGWWQELYLIFEAGTVDAFIQRGFLTKKRFMWPIAQAEVLLENIEKILRLCSSASEPFVTDRIDMVSEMLILDSLPHFVATEPSREERIVRELEQKLRKNCLEDIDIDVASKTYGMHPATLRRHWARLNPLPPARYAMRLRMNEACRMLAETGRPIRQIAYDLGFEDSLYFSRKFHREIGCTASEYRKRYHAALMFK